ncbi:acetyl-CoA synthetase-like protein [Trametes elegans]|nr:acetyl-CoA synthetase-like protein [Trametes elegans]
MPLNPADVPPHITTSFHYPLDLVKAGTTIPDLYDWCAKRNPNYPLFTYRDGGKSEYITYATAYNAIDRAARYILSNLNRGAVVRETQPTIAIFANTDTITYFTTVVGALTAGCTTLLVSTRNNPAGLADMLQRTVATDLFLSQDTAIRDIARGALDLLPAGQVTVHDMPTFEGLYATGNDSDNPAYRAEVTLPTQYDVDGWSVIFHSSGSTGHPKPIRWTHRQLASFGEAPILHGLDTAGYVRGCHGTPVFHGLGGVMYSASPICGFVIATFKPAAAPAFPTPDAIWEGVVATKSDFTWTVPSLIEASSEWSRDPEKVAVMKEMCGVLFGGAPLTQEVGDALAQQGVKLCTVYGITEAGCVNQYFQASQGLDWQYFTPSPNVPCRFVPHGENEYEFVILSTPERPLPVVNTKFDGYDAYATSDLVYPHPTKPNFWRILGRVDEQLLLSNGEKTNPLPLEEIINKDAHVKSSLMFGYGKVQNGVLVMPAGEYTIDPSDIEQVEVFRNNIWPSVERANEYAPQHSRIFKEMILVASKPFQLNVKGYPRRGIILKEYQDKIEQLYKEVEQSAQSNISAPEIWDTPSTLTFIRAVVEQTLRRSLSKDADIFRSGGDSLQAAWIRNTILRAIRESDPSAAKRLPVNFVFDAPTISALANLVHMAMNDVGANGNVSHNPQDLWKYVEKYSANFPARPSMFVDRGSSAEVVLITGTTGGFGCDALEHLLRDASVAQVYAFNRRGTDALARQHAQFRARGLDETLLDTPKFKMIEAVLHEPGFGLAPRLLEEIQGSVTHIMHNAWKVDFNLSLSSFGVDLQGARNLIDLAISSPFTQAPTILFVSSVSVFTNYEGPAPAPEAALDDPASAFGAGYSESKWVTERVLQNAAEERGIHSIVMRLGQVAGDKTGHWNEKEWFPALVRSAQFQRCLPDVEGNVTWVPGYEGAKAFTELRHSPEPFVHLVHPRPVSWRAVIAPVAAELGVPLVSHSEWLSALQKSVDAAGADEVELMKANPALRLLPFYRGCRASPEREPFGMVYLSTTTSAVVSQALADLPVLDVGWVKQWLEGWQCTRYLQCLTVGQ